MGDVVDATSPPCIYKGPVPQHHRLGNPAPLSLVVSAVTPSQLVAPNLGSPRGLFSFASTTLVLSLFNVNSRTITVSNVVVGMALFCGSLAQFFAGMWEFAAGNTFGATTFTSFGVFWLLFATILIPILELALRMRRQMAPGGRRDCYISHDVDARNINPLLVRRPFSVISSSLSVTSI
ncbi:hypothetical protein BV25DRAFT_226806 [Artomyces pyxidatus]|uniref:Uncharacterized protein n=1 Tax=Artomyces pyxidatus TaxID=48021 RepID=A0ACB8SFN3_9AGAM|nr:hypothetical protein BV25DRAFT_226806 [Artomyces pyxidatus]